MMLKTLSTVKPDITYDRSDFFYALLIVSFHSNPLLKPSISLYLFYIYTSISDVTLFTISLKLSSSCYMYNFFFRHSFLIYVHLLIFVQ